MTHVNVDAPDGAKSCVTTGRNGEVLHFSIQHGVGAVSLTVWCKGSPAYSNLYDLNARSAKDLDLYLRNVATKRFAAKLPRKHFPPRQRVAARPDAA